MTNKNIIIIFTAIILFLIIYLLIYLKKDKDTFGSCSSLACKNYKVFDNLTNCISNPDIKNHEQMLECMNPLITKGFVVLDDTIKAMGFNNANEYLVALFKRILLKFSPSTLSKINFEQLIKLFNNYITYSLRHNNYNLSEVAFFEFIKGWNNP